MSTLFSSERITNEASIRKPAPKQSTPMVREQGLETRHPSHVSRLTSQGIHKTSLLSSRCTPKPTTNALAQNIAPIDTSSCSVIEMMPHHHFSFNCCANMRGGNKNALCTTRFQSKRWQRCALNHGLHFHEGRFSNARSAPPHQT